MSIPTARQLYFAVLALLRDAKASPAGLCCIARFSRPTPGYCISTSATAARAVAEVLASVLERPFQPAAGEWIIEPQEAVCLVAAAAAANPMNAPQRMRVQDTPMFAS